MVRKIYPLRMKSYKCVLTGCVDHGLCCQPFHCYRFGSHPSRLPFSLCFISQFFLQFVMWKGPAGRTGLSVEQWSILIH